MPLSTSPHAEDAGRASSPAAGAAARGELADLFARGDYAEAVQRLVGMSIDDARQVLSGWDLNQRNARGDTLLHAAAGLMHHEGQLRHSSYAFPRGLVKAMIDAGADANALSYRNALNLRHETPLHRAIAPVVVDRSIEASREREVNVVTLLQYGADPSIRDDAGRDALAIAAETGSDRVTQALLLYGAHANATVPGTQWTAAHFLARRSTGADAVVAHRIVPDPAAPVLRTDKNEQDCCKLIAQHLVEGGALSLPDSSGKRPHQMCAPWLIPSLEALPAHQGHQASRAAAVHAALAASSGRANPSDDDLDAARNFAYPNENTLFRIAVRRGWIDVADRLLQRGVDPNWPFPALRVVAAAGCDPRLMALLLRHGARVDRTSNMSLAHVSDSHCAHALVASGSLRTASPLWFNEELLSLAREWRPDLSAALLTFYPAAALPAYRAATELKQHTPWRQLLRDFADFDGLVNTLRSQAVFSFYASHARQGQPFMECKPAGGGAPAASHAIADDFLRAMGLPRWDDGRGKASPPAAAPGARIGPSP